MCTNVKIEELYPEHQHSWLHLEDPVSSFLSPECPAADCRHREQISGDLTGGSLLAAAHSGPGAQDTQPGAGIHTDSPTKQDILFIYGAYLKVF